MLLEHVKGITPDAELEAEYNELSEKANALLSKLSVLLEAPMDVMSDRLAGQDAPPLEMGNTERMPKPGKVAPDADNMEEIMSAMEQVMQQMEAAKRGMGLVNKLSDSASRTKNKSRVMGNMNRIRANIGRVEKMLAAGIDNNPGMRDELEYDRTGK